MNNIHPTAIVSPKAELGDNNEIMPHVIIQDDVQIGNDCSIGPFSVIYNGARIGNRVRIKQASSVAHVPQDLSFSGEYSQFLIGDDTIIHEFTTLHRGTKVTGKSQVGNNCLLMAYVHIAHDSTIGNNVILANGVQVAGHCLIEDYAIIGGLTPVHQFCKVGKHSMTGGGFRITQDVPPFILTAGYPLKFSGLNVIGLRRRGFSNEEIQNLKTAYNYIYDHSLNISQAKERILSELKDKKYISDIIDFLNKSKRGIVGK